MKRLFMVMFVLIAAGFVRGDAGVTSAQDPLILLLPLTARSQNTSLTPDDREVDRVQAMVLQSKKEGEQFSKSGGKASDPKHPNLKWAAKLWRYRDKHPGTPATTIATAEALRLLYRVDRMAALCECSQAHEESPELINRLVWLLINSRIHDNGSP